ncbi:GNAT family N-acetyltransferase [Clostridium sp.]|uniref:GNAT family N-acetyltransferase n=1 Tax=Clostridium sp. TaxID=1506 RepID=UPI002FC75923
MKVYENIDLNLQAYSLDTTRWEDFQDLFGDRGACGGCWCMSWRLKKSVFESQKGIENKLAMKTLVEQNETIGVLVYIDGKPIGWCAVAPRENYIRLENSKVFKRIDDEPVWSITCFYILKSYRRQGISSELIRAAVSYCKLNHAEIVEAYPLVPYDEKVPDPFLWTGTPVAFQDAGFFVVEQRSRWKLMMRYYI